MKMKIKKFAAVLLAFVLAFALSVPAFAAVGPDDYRTYVEYQSSTDRTITIIPSDGEDLSGTSFVAYKVFDLVDVYTSGTTTHYAYDLEDAFYGFFAGSDYLNCVVEDVTSEDAYNSVQDLSTAAQLNKFGKDVTTYVSSYSGNNLVSKTGTASEENYKFTSLDAGYYVIDETTTASATYNPMVYAVVTNYNDVTITRKGSTPTIDKSVVGAEDSDSNGIADYLENYIDQIGATVPFQLTSEIPNMTGIASYKFVFTDVLSDGLTYNDDLAVTIDGTTLTEVTDYTESFDSGANTLTITFITTDWATGYSVGDAIVATYSATINSNAIVNNEEDNTATLTYTNNSGEDQNSVPSNVQVSELDFTILKTNDKDEEPTTLEGAEFALYTTRTGSEEPYEYSNPVKFSKGGTNTDTYYVNSSGNATLTSDDSGLIKINGLGAGTYYLVETKAPAGYNLLTEAVTITVTAELADLDSDSVADDIRYSASGDGISNNAIAIQNTTGVELPSTGGIGTVMFKLGGSAILLLAGAFLVVNRKKVFGSGK